jgi:UDP-glucose 4-epimerase
VRVLVTGGSGFIGSHVVDKLRERGITVRVFDMVYPSFRGDIEFYRGSILDLEQVRMALNDVDAVMHLAAVADVKDVLEDPYYAQDINVRGTANVLEAMRRARVTRLVYGSTTWVYGDVEQDSVDETTPLAAPSHLYTATKIAGEYYCQTYGRLYGLETTILRYGIPYGPRARPSAVIPIFVDKALKGETIKIAGDGSQYRKFVYVEDLADGNVLALRPVARNRIYNLDGGEKITVRGIAETVQQIVGKVAIEHTSARPGDFSGKEVSSRRAFDELGWAPRVPFQEGVKRYVEWFRREKRERDARYAQAEESLKARAPKAP